MAGLTTCTIATGGASCTFYIQHSTNYDPSEIGDTVTNFQWNGTSYSFTCRKSFRYVPNASGGETVTFADDGISRLGLVCVGQSNMEGRGDTTAASTVVNPGAVYPNTLPYDENMTGPGAPNQGGPALKIADEIISHASNTYDRITIYSASTGTQSVADLYGTNGDDGTYNTQIVHADIMDLDAVPYMQPNDDYVIIYNQTASDAGTAPADWSADVTTLLDHIRTSDFSGYTCKGIVIAQASPSAPDDQDPSVSHPDWDTIRTEQASLSDPTGSPPVIVVAYQDSDRESGDKVHYSMSGQERWGAAVASALFSNGVLP